MEFKSVETEQALLFAIFAVNVLLEDMDTGSVIKSKYEPQKGFLRYCGECFADEIIRRQNSKTAPEKVDVSSGLCHDDCKVA